MKPKILIFSLAYYPRVAGAEVAIKEITDRITDIEFHMVTMRFSPADAQTEQVGNVLVHRLGKSGSYLDKVLFIPRAALAGRRLHRKEQFSGAWAMMSYMVLPLVLMRLLGTTVPYALTLQEGDTEHHMFGRLRVLPFLPLLRAGFKNARAVSALSTFLAEWGKRMGYRGAVVVVPNGADVARFTGPAIPHEGVVLIHTGRLVHKNGLDDVIRALPQVPQVRLRLVGDGSEKEALERLARECNVAERVEFIPYVSHEKLPALLHESDIFVRPSRSEGFGASFAEAFAARLPVIATQEGGLADFITEEVAWPVKKDSPKEIAKRVEQILGNPERTAEVIRNARTLVEQKYDWDLIAKDMRDKVFSRLF